MATGTVYCPVCRWEEEEVSCMPERCPQCGYLNIRVVVMQEDEREGPPEFVFSESQLAREWPRGFWHSVAGRIASGEVVVASKTAGKILQRVARPKPAPAGRKPGPLFITDEEAFRRTVRQAVDQLKQAPTRINVTTVAQKCGWARGTLYRYAKDFQINAKAFIRELVRSSEGSG